MKVLPFKSSRQIIGVKKQTSQTMPQIGVRIRVSNIVGVKIHQNCYPLLTALTVLFAICWIMALLNMIGINV